MTIPSGPLREPLNNLRNYNMFKWKFRKQERLIKITKHTKVNYSYWAIQAN